jgi:hypothetical protein
MDRRMDLSICNSCGKPIIWAINELASRVSLEECKSAVCGIHSPDPIAGQTFDVMKPPVKIYISHATSCRLNRLVRKNRRIKETDEVDRISP